MRYSQKISLLLFGSGFCALIYQMTWLRILRLVFGSSTSASSAVLAIFMGGLGLGAWLFGHRADASKTPLKLYAHLELGVTLAAAISPFLLVAVRSIYLALGGEALLGSTGGTLLRLGLSAFVLGIPTVLMGGTLPAAVKAAEQREDLSRRHLGLIYGTNTIGAVLGAFMTTFFFLEWMGIRMTLWFACGLNFLIFFAALRLFQVHVKSTTETPSSETDNPPPSETDNTSREKGPFAFLAFSAMTVGFAFFLMELVWYRMLSPLLGGSSYTFGTILIVALLGVGLGGLIYAMGAQKKRPTLQHFALTCALESFFLIIPFAAGDQLAYFAAIMRAWGASSFFTLVTSWLLMSLLVVFPASLLAGYQFPLLIALLGPGEEEVGQEVGRIYASNTFGSILGSLLGGFWLIPLFTATGVWRWLAVFLLLLASLAFVMHLRTSTPTLTSGLLLVLGLSTIWMTTSTGPSAAWRHSTIGAGRSKLATAKDANNLRKQFQEIRWSTLWEKEGLESSIGLNRTNGISLYVNGKSDGNARTDASTGVFLSLFPGALHSNPKHVLIVGLGTGTTAGWIAKDPRVERVDVLELESEVVAFAKRCAAVNQDALNNPKVNVIIGDARELLLTTKRTYDIIVSQPSNPYRAGISSLFSKEFYEAVIGKLKPNGLFAQWLQMYEASPKVLGSVSKTLQSVFPATELWESEQRADLLMVSGRKRWTHDLKKLRKRLQLPIYQQALRDIWGVKGVHGLFTGYVGSFDIIRDIVKQNHGKLNTDDAPFVEFDFSKNVGQNVHIEVSKLRKRAHNIGAAKPHTHNGTLNWQKVIELRSSRTIIASALIPIQPYSAKDSARRQLARNLYQKKQYSRVLKVWDLKKDSPLPYGDLLMLAHVTVMQKNPAASSYLEQIKSVYPIDYKLSKALQHALDKQPAEKVAKLLHEAFKEAQTNPWFSVALMEQALPLSFWVANQSKAHAKNLFETLKTPFAVRILDLGRSLARLSLANHIGFLQHCVSAFKPFEPHVLWTEAILQSRLACYKHHKSPLLSRAQRELNTYRANKK